MSEAASNTSLADELASETIDWMADDRSKPDVTGEVWAFTLATYVDGTPIATRGFDVSDAFGPARCIECFEYLDREPPGSTICRDCFFGPRGERQ
jgi:hypothetical protein